MPYADPEKQREFQRKRVARIRAEWLAAHGPCCKCGSWEEIEVDHKSREEKVTHRVWSWAESRRLEELSKCQILCCVCHKAKTKSEFTVEYAHGSDGMYSKRGCRCDICRKGHRERKAEYRARTGKNSNYFRLQKLARESIV